jgi:hypothetical protein
LNGVNRKGQSSNRRRKKGFGSVLIERAIARELNADIALDFDPAGVRCRLRTQLEGRSPGFSDYLELTPRTGAIAYSPCVRFS